MACSRRRALSRGVLWEGASRERTGGVRADSMRSYRATLRRVPSVRQGELCARQQREMSMRRSIAASETGGLAPTLPMRLVSATCPAPAGSTGVARRRHRLAGAADRLHRSGLPGRAANEGAAQLRAALPLVIAAAGRVWLGCQPLRRHCAAWVYLSVVIGILSCAARARTRAAVARRRKRRARRSAGDQSRRIPRLRVAASARRARIGARGRAAHAALPDLLSDRVLSGDSLYRGAFPAVQPGQFPRAAAQTLARGGSLRGAGGADTPAGYLAGSAAARRICAVAA